MNSAVDFQDAMFLHLEKNASPMHIGTLAVFPEGGVPDFDGLLDRIDSLIEELPRFRQVIRKRKFDLVALEWADASGFDLAYHVRRAALPAPGGPRQLGDLVARIFSRPLERSRPLWEMYVIEGFADGSVALFCKTHQALIDGFGSPDLLHVLLDETPDGGESRELPLWMSSEEPAGLPGLIAGVAAALSDPARVAAGLRDGIGHMLSLVGEATDSITGIFNPAFGSEGRLLRSTGTGMRRVAFADVPLTDIRGVVDAFRSGAGSVTTHDVVLALLCGVLRSWYSSRGMPLAMADSVRAMVPLSVHEESDEDGGTGPEMTSHLIDLPIGEANPRMRLAQIARQTLEHRAGGRAVDARTLTRLSGFAPPTLHAMGLRAAVSTSRRLSQVYIANAPGPQSERFLGESRLSRIFPVPALIPGQSLAVGVTSYDGRFFIGFTADRDAVPDLDAFPQMLEDALHELCASRM